MLSKLITNIGWINSRYIKRTSTPSIDLLIIDNAFPHPVSAFRLEEFTSYLHHFKRIHVLCNGTSTNMLSSVPFEDILIQYRKKYPEFSNKISKELPILPKKHTIKFAYFCFLANAYAAIDYIEENRIPFAFELYPGGGFQIDSVFSDRMLWRVTSSPYFRKVVVTQDVTRLYLLEHGFCEERQVLMVFGAVMPIKRPMRSFRLNQKDKALQICFVAMRYTMDGADKGYDLFLEIVAKFIRKQEHIQFHVVGSFDAKVIPLGGTSGRITFHGVLAAEDLSRFLQKMDIIVSPNKDGVLAKGAFDGFPTCSCIEAGMCGVLILCTDPLNLNGDRFRNGEEIEILKYDSSAFAEKIMFYYYHRDVLHSQIKKQYKRIRKLYSYKAQMKPRIQMIQQEIKRYSKTMYELTDTAALETYYLQGKLFYSSFADRFNQSDVIEFDIQVSIQDVFKAKIALGDIDKKEAYIWIYLIVDHRNVIEFNQIKYDSINVSILESNGTYMGNKYLFEEKPHYIYLGLVRGISSNCKFLEIAGNISPLSDK